MHYPRIRNVREDLDFTQAEVAKHLNCSQVAYSYYETGKRDIPSEVLIELAKLFHCSTDYLLGISDKKI